MIGLALIGGALIALIFFFVGAQECVYHPELAGTTQYQECHFQVGSNWPFLVLALLLVGVGVWYLPREGKLGGSRRV